jgi:hypothetical protein
MRAAACCALVLFAAPAWGQRGAERVGPVARIELSRAPEAAGCPDEPALRRAVSRRLGRDPFSETSTRRARLSFSADGSGLALSIELVASDGTTLGQRTIRSPTRDCAELGESAAVALLVAIDVLEASAARDAQSAPDTAPSSEPASPSTTVAPVASTPPSAGTLARPVARSAAVTPTTDRLTGYIAINAVTSVGDLPLVAFGGALRFGVRWRSLGLYAEGRAMLPSAIDAPRGARVESSLYTGSALSCFHRGWFAACGVASFGALLARGSNVDRPREPTIAVISAGARAAGSWRIPGDFFIDTSVEVLGSLVRPTLTINAEPAWDAPPLQGSLRLGVGVELR